MPTLHIEHPITDLTVWKAAFDRFADLRVQSGVRGHRIQQPVADPHYIVIDLDFETTDQATLFLAFLETKVWSNSDSAPALAGKPRTAILDLVEAR